MGAETIPVPDKKIFLASKLSSLSCPAYGYKGLVRVWSKDGNNVDLSGRRVNMTSSGMLVFGSAELGDAGLYTCTVSNKVGDKEYTSMLIVNVTVVGKLFVYTWPVIECGIVWYSGRETVIILLKLFTIYNACFLRCGFNPMYGANVAWRMLFFSKIV